MRKPLFLLIIALVAVGLTAGSASALNLGMGEFLAKIEDHSATYDVATGNPLPLRHPAQNFLDDEEQRTIFRVTNIIDINSGADVFNTSSPTELTGTLYDLLLTPANVHNPSPGLFILDFVPRDRNPLLTDNETLDPTADLEGVISPNSGNAYDIGGVMELWEDGTKDYTPDPNGVGRYDAKLPAAPPIPYDPGAGPLSWVEGSAGHDSANGVADSFPTVTDGNLILSAALLDLQYLVDAGAITDPALLGLPAFAAGAVLRETLDLTAGTGSGFAYANVFENLGLNPMLQAGYAGDPYADLALLFDINTPRFDFGDGQYHDTVVYRGPGQWNIDSQDPVVFATIPEPGTMALLGMGCVALFGLRRKKS
jgi:hypothetical protein